MHPGSQPTDCRWCNELVTRRNLHRHFRDECVKLPELREGQRICTRCQQAKEAIEFPKRNGTENLVQHTCKSCSLENSRAWFENRRANRAADRERRKRLRPGRWVLRPCEFCGALFSWAEMKKHRRKCEKRPVKYLGRPPGVSTEEALAGMDAMKRDAMTTNGRSHKAYQLRWSYGITIEEFERLYREQNGCCAICRTAPNGHDYRTSGLHVDHDHRTGKVRALLCNRCNHGIGNFREDPALLMQAIGYILSRSRIVAE